MNSGMSMAAQTEPMPPHLLSSWVLTWYVAACDVYFCGFHDFKSLPPGPGGIFTDFAEHALNRVLESPPALV